LDSNGSY